MASENPRVAIVGGGPAGLMAAEALGAAGIEVHVFDRMPSVGRKFLMAGKGGLNITHSEPYAAFLDRYGERRERIAPLLGTFGPQAIRQWMHGLGVDSFVGSSGRVFPAGMRAAPLLRAWQHRLRQTGVRFHVRHRWAGLEKAPGGPYRLVFETPDGTARVDADAVVFALGGGSWSKLGSDGRWVGDLAALGVPTMPLRPANCGFDVAWSPYFRERFAGQPVKNVALAFAGQTGSQYRRGEIIITADGIEGGAVYALSAPLRDAIERDGYAELFLDLLPEYTLERVAGETSHPRGSRSLSSHLQSRLGLKGVKVALLHERLSRADLLDSDKLAQGIKALPLRLIAPRPIDEAISSAGGVRFEALDEGLMLRAMPGVFCAGEMLDWEAPTGGYLLSACLASGLTAGKAATSWLRRATMESS